jgi:hypothetical protein
MDTVDRSLRILQVKLSDHFFFLLKKYHTTTPLIPAVQQMKAPIEKEERPNPPVFGSAPL